MKNSKTKNVDKSFVKVKCPDCGNEQIVFIRASTQVKCQVCGATIAIPTGGKANIRGEIIEVYT